MKIKDGFWVREVGGANIAVPVSGPARALKCVVNLNESGALLFKLMQTETTAESMTRALLDAYDTTPQEARRAADSFARQLLDARLLEE